MVQSVDAGYLRLKKCTVWGAIEQGVNADLLLDFKPAALTVINTEVNSRRTGDAGAQEEHKNALLWQVRSRCVPHLEVQLQ